MLDQGELREYDPAERPSLFRSFHRFTGEQARAATHTGQLAAYTLPT